MFNTYVEHWGIVSQRPTVSFLEGSIWPPLARTGGGWESVDYIMTG